MDKKRATKRKPEGTKSVRRKGKSAYGSGCLNRECKLRKGGCTGFEGCPGYKRA